MARKHVDVAVIIADASPVLTLARIGRVDLLGGSGRGTQSLSSGGSRSSKAAAANKCFSTPPKLPPKTKA
jgi:hypothetical protein